MEGKELESRDSVNVLDRLPFNLTQLLAFATQKKRDQSQAMEDAIEQLRAMPQFASKAYYSIPFKKWVNGKQVEEIVEGPSIKAATALTGCWGNNIEGAFMGEETDDYVDVSGYFFDIETGKLTIRPWRVSKTYRGKDGKVQQWRYDMLQKQIMAGVSKAIRNADLNGLPAGYVAEYYAEAKRIAARGGKVQESEKQDPADDVKAISQQIENCISRFEEMGVGREDTIGYINRHRDLENEEMVAAHLIGLLNALEEGQVVLEDVFTAPQASEPIAEPQRTTGQNKKPMENTAATEEPKKRKLPEDRKRTQSKFSGATCAVCGKAIKKDQWIYKNDRDQWVHEETC
jgi:hypothetical protein